MTDLGTADRIYVCGPTCKAIEKTGEIPLPVQEPWWEKPGAYFLWALIGFLAFLGSMDVIVRLALNYWNIPL